MTLLQNNFDQFTLNGPYTYKNLSLFSIQSSQKEQNSYMCLGDENLKNFTVSEKQQAEVPYILISNKNDFPVFILDGTLLDGCKQNRITDMSLMIPGNVENFEIPVSCVERGRWHYKNDFNAFNTSKTMLYHKARFLKMKSVNENKKASQDTIWSSIDEKAANLGSTSESAAMDGIYEKQQEALEQFSKVFKLENKDLGLVYAINNHIVGVDLFCHHSILNFYFLSIIQSLALDCIETEDTGLAPSKTEAVNFFKHVLMSNFEEWIVLDPSALHKGESNIANSNLLFFQNKFVHLTSFPKELNY